jgi:hypothetical protein
MRPEYHSSDGDDLTHYFIIFTQCPVQLIIVVFEFIFLKQHYPSTVRYVHTHAIWGKKKKRTGAKKKKRMGAKKEMRTGIKGMGVKKGKEERERKGKGVKM